MKILLSVLGGIIAIYLLLCAVGPAKFEVNRSAEMDAPAQIVYANVADFKTWEKWSPWHAMDKDIKLTYGASTMGKGGTYAWESSVVGSGNMEFVEASTNKSLKTKIQFKDHPGDSFGNWSFESISPEKTKVSWGMNGGDLPFFTRAIVLVTGGISSTEKAFEDGLNNLKTLSEEMAANVPTSFRGYDIKEMEMATKFYATAKKELSFTEIADHYKENFPKMGAVLGKSGHEMQGPPTGLFYKWDMEKGMADMAAAVPVMKDTELEGFETVELAGGKCLHIDYYGAYEKSENAHYAMDDYMKAHGLKQLSPVIEEYITDPTTEPDTSKWLTKIYYMVEKDM